MSELQQHQGGPAHFHLRGEDLEKNLRGKETTQAEVFMSKSGNAPGKTRGCPRPYLTRANPIRRLELFELFERLEPSGFLPHRRYF
jgi:hypothetical protein